MIENVEDGRSFVDWEYRIEKGNLAGFMLNAYHSECSGSVLEFLLSEVQEVDLEVLEVCWSK